MVPLLLLKRTPNALACIELGVSGENPIIGLRSPWPLCTMFPFKALTFEVYLEDDPKWSLSIKVEKTTTLWT